ncbi:MAG: dienelactone hydrolase family protein [Thermodesulfobacteriota bacterium]
MTTTSSKERIVHIPDGDVRLEGSLGIPEGAPGVVLFAHGSGSSRHSPRNNFVARELQKAGLGTLLMDLLTREEDMDYDTRFDIALLARRLRAATAWLAVQDDTKGLKIGYFGASTGSAAALRASVPEGERIGAIVSRGGRPDLAMEALPDVKAPTLLIVGGLDDVVIGMNQKAYDALNATKEMVIVPGATHLFEEPGTLEEVAGHAVRWFKKHLQ